MASARELDTLLAKAMSAHQAGRLTEAQTSYKALLKKVPGHFPTLHFLGLSYLQQGEADRGIKCVEKALVLKPDYVEAHYNLATALQRLGRFEKAADRYKSALAINPNNPDAHNNLGTALQELKRYEEAIAHYHQALALRPSAEPHNNIGTALKALHRYKEAITHFRTALSISPGNVETCCNLGAALQDAGEVAESLAVYDAAVALDPRFADAELGRGNTLSKLKRFDEALAAFDRALTINPSLAEAWLGRGNVYADLERYDEASAAYEKTLALKHDLAEAWFGRGRVCMERRLPAEAFAAFDKAFALTPDLPEAEGQRLGCKMQLCEWLDFDLENAHLVSSVRKGKANAVPFAFLATSASAADQLRCAEFWVSNRFPSSAKSVWKCERYNHDRIRVAYLSADFREHPIAFLAAGLFERHDKSRFETIAVSIGRDDRSEVRQRLKASFDRFIDAKTYDDDQTANLIRSLEVDILVDLMGFTAASRTGIFARRPAPIQVNYLGYPGTMGAPYIDYIIADRTIIPKSQEVGYAEKVIVLPHCYQITDSRRLSSARLFTRSELGLPDIGFVFCCFNNNYKITPAVFDRWMKILQRVAGSVLWLLEDNAKVAINLRKEAAARAIDPERLVFAKRMPPADHLSRQRCADLFLDTLPYNAHSTASDALWAGLPVVTCRGETFAGRVAASILQAIGLPELVTTTLEDYERLIIELAERAELLAAVKQKLANNRLTTALFDTTSMTRHIEAAFTAMIERHRAGLPPEAISIPG